MEFIRNLFAPPVFENDIEKTRVARNLSLMLGIAIFGAVLVGIILFFISSNDSRTINSLPLFVQAVLWTFLLIVNRSGRTYIAAFMYVLLTFLFVSFAFIVAANISQSVTILGFALVLALSALLLTPAMVFGFFGLVMFAIGGMQVAIQRGFVQPAASITDPTQIIAGYVIIFLLLAIILAIAANSYQIATREVITHGRLLDEKNLELEHIRISLEREIQEREQTMKRRNLQLEAAAEAGKAITSIRNIDELLNETCTIISERFGFYHVGVFLLDPAGEYAVLQAANSQGGKVMLNRKHRLKVGEIGMVGNVTQSGQARIALDVGHDAIFFNNPDLPDTHSEMALPITIGNVILGALDVQSIETSAFNNDDIATLQILADQLAIGIQNARLFEENQNTLEASRRAYGELSRSDWQKLLKSQGQLGYVGGSQGTIQSAPVVWETESLDAMKSGDISLSNENQSLGIPVKIRGQSIGAIRMRKQDNSQPWSQEETSLAVTFAEQLSSALESARLYQDAQARASHETIVSEISARINATPNIEAILKETVQELGLALGNSTVSFQLIDPGKKQDDGAHE